MDTLQFSLFFAALFIGYLLVHLRLVKFEAYLREISGLKLLNERFQGVSDVLARINLDHVEDRLDMLQQELRSLVEIAQRLERSTSRARQHVEPVASASSTPSAAERIRALIETRLLSLGYGNLHIVSDLSEASYEDEFTSTVECDKNQMAYKGKVTTCNGEVRDVSLDSVSQAFP